MENTAKPQNHYAYNKQLRPLAHKLRYTIRQHKLEEAGFTIIRFQDNEVLKEIEFVRRNIEITIEEIESKLSTPFIPRQRGKVPNKKL